MELISTPPSGLLANEAFSKSLHFPTSSVSESMTSVISSKRKWRKRKNRKSESPSPKIQRLNPGEESEPLDLVRKKVVDSDGNTGKEPSLPSNSKTGLAESGVKPKPKSRSPREIFPFGNYNRYYGYRNGTDGNDLRLQSIKKEWIEGKDILDIGCNIGHVTWTIARDFKPRRIRGVDIDRKLIEIAKKNVFHYTKDRKAETSESTILETQIDSSAAFPNNVSFQQENYVLECDELLDSVKGDYDVLFCLSLTKWVHLNFGDDGLKRFFHRSFRHLRPNGLLILEPQPWSSYNGKKNLTATISKNSKNIRFFPDQFQTFLLKEVGFSSVEAVVEIPKHAQKGFRRPLLIFTKGSPVELS